MKLSEQQHWALLTAYATDVIVTVRFDPEDTGFAKSTLRSLVRKGLLGPPADGDDWSECAVTEAGLVALGVSPPPVGDVEAVLARAIELLIPYELDENEPMTGDEIPRACVEEDWANDTTVWVETDGFRAAVTYQHGAMLHDNDLDCTGFDVVWDAVARLLTVAGYPTQVERHNQWLYLAVAEV